MAPSMAFEMATETTYSKNTESTMVSCIVYLYQMRVTSTYKIGRVRNLPMSRASVPPRRKTSRLEEVYEHKGFLVELKPENP